MHQLVSTGQPPHTRVALRRRWIEAAASRSGVPGEAANGAQFKRQGSVPVHPALQKQR